MAFWATLIQTLIKMVIVGAGAFAGIMLGKKSPKKKKRKRKLDNHLKIGRFSALFLCAVQVEILFRAVH